MYRNFSRSGSIPSLYASTAERLSRDVEITAVCASRGRAPTDARIRFLDVEPALTGRGRLSYAIECHSFARRATRAVLGGTTHYDVVHSEGFACLWADVVTAHAVRRAELEHYFEHVEPAAGVRRHLSPILFRPQTGTVLRIEKKQFSPPAPLIICPSTRVKSDLYRWHGVPDELVAVIPYGIDLASFHHDPRGRARVRKGQNVDDDTTVILSVGDEFERKGIARLIEALGLSRARAELWVIGGDDPHDYLELARSVGVADRVTFLGRRPYDELPQWYSGCDVMAVVSRQDSWAIPVTEGMAAGRTVLTSEFAGSDEAIVSGETGFVVGREGDPREIAALLDGPLADASVREAVGARAAAEARRFDLTVTYSSLLDVYERAARRRSERPMPPLHKRPLHKRKSSRLTPPETVHLRESAS